MNEIPKITYLGQSSFYLETSDSALLIDPSNRESGSRIGDIVYCTHSHSDHTGGVIEFMNRNPDAILLGNRQVTERFSQYGVRAVTCDDGGTFERGSWKFQFTKLMHGFFKGAINLGAIVTVNGFSFAHCGDAVSFEGFPKSDVDVLAIPIGGVFTASPKRALEMIKNLQPPIPIIVPIHWLFKSPKGFCESLVKKIPEVRCIIPIKGEPLHGFA